MRETRFADKGILKESGGGYTLWRGKPETADRIYGVGLAIRTSLLKSIPTLSVGINKHLMKLRFSLDENRHTTIISAYTPTFTSTDEAKEKFYKDLDQLIRSTPASDKVLILDDFNARVGENGDN